MLQTNKKTYTNKHKKQWFHAVFRKSNRTINWESLKISTQLHISLHCVLLYTAVHCICSTSLAHLQQMSERTHALWHAIPIFHWAFPFSDSNNAPLSFFDLGVHPGEGGPDARQLARPVPARDQRGLLRLHVRDRSQLVHQTGHFLSS